MSDYEHECRQCGVSFHSHSPKSLYCSSSCKDRYRYIHSNRGKERQKWREDNRERDRESNRRFYRLHHDKLIEDMKEAYRNNIDSRREYARSYYEEHRAARLEYARTHLEQRLESNRRWRDGNPEKYMESVAKARRKRCMRSVHPHSVADELSIYRRQGGRCAYCNVHIPFKNGEIDHIVPLSRGGDDDCGNICFSCVHCNRTKSSKFVVEFKHKEEL